MFVMSSLFDPDNDGDPKEKKITDEIDLTIYDKDYNSVKSKGEVFLYRTSLILSSIAYGTYWAVTALELSSGSGIDSTKVQGLTDSSHTLSSWGMLLSALSSPAYLGAITDSDENNDAHNAILLLLNEALPQLALFAIFVQIVNVVQSSLSSGNVDFISTISSGSFENTTNIFIVGICLREIGFYGIGYKAEAALAILLCLALVLNDQIGMSETALSAGLALCLLVLSFGKLFEPFEDDMRPNYSKFFQD